MTDRKGFKIYYGLSLTVSLKFACGEDPLQLVEGEGKPPLFVGFDVRLLHLRMCGLHRALGTEWQRRLDEGATASGLDARVDSLDGDEQFVS